MYLILAAFITGMNLAVDTTAGERERQSLEPLLINPVSHLSLMLGKWLSAVVFSCAGIILTMASLVLAMQRMSWQELGIRLNLGAPEVASGEPVSLLSYAATNLSSLMLGLLRVWITARLFTRENVVFGR